MGHSTIISRHRLTLLFCCRRAVTPPAQVDEMHTATDKVSQKIIEYPTAALQAVVRASRAPEQSSPPSSVNFVYLSMRKDWSETPDGQFNTLSNQAQCCVEAEKKLFEVIEEVSSQVADGKGVEGSKARLSTVTISLADAVAPSRLRRWSANLFGMCRPCIEVKAPELVDMALGNDRAGLPPAYTAVSIDMHDL